MNVLQLLIALCSIWLDQVYFVCMCVCAKWNYVESNVYADSHRTDAVGSVLFIYVTLLNAIMFIAQ